MADKSPSSWKATVARWLGLQVASKAVAVALGTPAVTGAMMAGLAYAQGLPLAWGFFAVVGVTAFTSILINQSRSFLVAYSPAGKIQFGAGEVIWAKSKGGVDGYGLGVNVSNLADIPLEYRMQRLSANIEGIVVRGDDQNSLNGGVLGAGVVALHAVGVAKMARMPSAHIQGEVEFVAAYGRPGRLSHVVEHKFGLLIRTDANGQTNDVRFTHQRVTDH